MSQETVQGGDNLSEKDLAANVENLNLAGTGQKAERQEIKKIDIVLHATGSAPILKQKKWSVDQEKPISGIVKFIHKYLKLDPEERLFLYINQTFAPSPDQIIKNLYECYGTNGKLNLHYAKTQAWG
ncbi:autophagy protein 12-like [Anopheles ziemanni]|uniref:autophagy protein 12-like n=1 Tax=Anopheles coustani TaxID=139045 RepID=UPI002659D3F1|nr:autophagy protein 12-like [Anopheles coustani]XP_058178680.1 autophagy protein 12-like [Anopheles ziemanni]